MTIKERELLIRTAEILVGTLTAIEELRIPDVFPGLRSMQHDLLAAVEQVRLESAVAEELAQRDASKK